MKGNLHFYSSLYSSRVQLFIVLICCQLLQNLLHSLMYTLGIFTKFTITCCSKFKLLDTKLASGLLLEHNMQWWKKKENASRKNQSLFRWLIYTRSKTDTTDIETKQLGCHLSPSWLFMTKTHKQINMKEFGMCNNKKSALYCNVTYLVLPLSFNVICNKMLFSIKWNGLEISHSCCTSTKTEEQ